MIATEEQNIRDYVARHPEIVEQMPSWASDYVVDLEFSGGDDALVLYVHRGQYGMLNLAGLVTGGRVEFANNDPAHFAAHDQDVPLGEFLAFAAEVTSFAELVETSE